MNGVTEVRVTRSRDVLEGQILPVTGRLRRHGRLELLVVLPDGTSRLIPQAWTDNGDGDGTGAAGATLGSVSDLLASCVLVAALRARAAGITVAPAACSSRAASSSGTPPVTSSLSARPSSSDSERPPGCPRSQTGSARRPASSASTTR